MFWRPPYIAYPQFLKFCPMPSPFPVASNPQPPLFIPLSFFFGWMDICDTFDVLFYLMISWMDTCWALGPWCMFYATRCHVFWGLTYDVVFCWHSDLLSHTNTHTQKHNTSGARRLTHPYKYIFMLSFKSSQ